MNIDRKYYFPVSQPQLRVQPMPQPMQHMTQQIQQSYVPQPPIFSPVRISPSKKPIDYKSVELEKDMKIIIESNHRMKEQLMAMTVDYESLRTKYELFNQEHIQLQQLTETLKKELKNKQELIIESQTYIEQIQNNQGRNNEELQQLRVQLQFRDQEILRYKQQFEEKNLELMETKNTLGTINNKVNFITQQRDQQLQITEQFNKELQAELTQKNHQLHQLSQSLTQTQQQLANITAEYNNVSSKVNSIQNQLPLHQLQNKYLLLCTENERLHSVVESESKRNKESLQKNQLQLQEINNHKYELQRLSEEFQRLQQALQYEQRNQFLIDDLRKQVNFYADENARLNSILYK
ncbi:hypothetical protein pb186bvf_001304 [Paramecium bursaria]